VVEPALLTDASRWVEWAPVRAGTAAAPADHPWSSASHHVGSKVDANITEHPHHWRLGNTPFEREAGYPGLRQQPLPAAQEARIENAVSRGWALGSAAFVHAMGERASRRVAPLARGRPPKKSVPK